MNRYLVLFLIIFLMTCEKDRSPLQPLEKGTIKIAFVNEQIIKNSYTDSLNMESRAAKQALVNQLEVRILKSDNTQVDSKTFSPSGGYFEGYIQIKAQNNLKVLCIGTHNGVVERFGVDDDVDVQAGKTTTADITGWTDPYIPQITGITPNPSTTGSYTVLWSQSANAATYVLQEADNQEFSGAVASYSTISHQISISGKGAGTRYYRVQADNDYSIKSGWSPIEPAVVQNTHTISGSVSGADGVLVTLDGDASDTQTVNDGEAYSFIVAEGGSYTVTPSKKGYSFTPPVQTYNNITTSQTRDFSCSRNSYTISGTVTGADGVMVILGGDVSDSRTVDDGGTYSFSVGGGGSYTVTPIKTGCLFNPASSSFIEIVSDQTLNFTGTSSITYTLSGTVSGADGVTITLGGDASGSQVVNDGGSYSFVVADGGSYTVTPTKSGYTFTPSGKNFDTVSSDQAQNFTAQVITHTISGTVSGAAGVTMSLSGDASESTVVNSDGGMYSFTVSEGGSYTVTPSKSGYTFTPSGKTFSAVTSNTIQDFTAVIETYTISGTITGADRVTVILSGDKEQSLTVDDGGTYSFTVDYGGDYTVTPTKDGYTFTPESRTFSNVTSNQMQNFNASQNEVPTEIDITMVSIPGGTFQMGLAGIFEPVHTVTLSAFEISMCEITQGQYKSIIGTNPSYFTGYDTLPVEQVSWWDAITFCNAQSDEAGLEQCYNESTGACDFTKNGFRLPTEAEWEYACRAGTTTNYYTGDSVSDCARAGWYFSNSGSTTHQVGQKEPNVWGLYDMHGNVWEWCNDWYGSYPSGSVTDPIGAQTDSYRVVRGGSWMGSVDGSECRAFNRSCDNPSGESNIEGFRIVRRPATQNTYSISGSVTGADGVTVTLSGSASGNQVVNSGGSYSFTVAESGTYTVTPSKAGYTFTQASQTFTNVTANQIQNFTVEEITPSGGRIAFSSDRDGNYEIYVMDADGSNKQRLTNNPADDKSPSWSPDGSNIAFASYREGNNEIYVMDADGSNQINLTNNLAWDYDPSWSPDGARIAFASTRDGIYEIYVMDADGSNQRRMTNNERLDYTPSWSPDGSRIAFVSERDGNGEIYVMDADGGNQRNLTNNPAGDVSPSWSPDGTRIAFTSNRDGNREIYVMDADGGSQQRLINNPANDNYPSWSPDGTRIAFSSTRDDNGEIYVMDADGSNQRNLTNNPSFDNYPSWSPF